MIELYHCHDARSFRTLWALEELGLEYDLHMLPFPPRAHGREYLKLNPLGTIPLMIDGETRMTESAATVEYLSQRYGEGALSLKPDEPLYGAFLNGLFFGEATLTFPQTLVLRYSRLEAPERRLPQAAEDYAAWFAARAKRMALHGDYAAGRFSGADISIGYAFLLANELGLADRLTPEATAYWARLQTREAYARARQAQAEAAVAQGLATTDLRNL